MALNSGKILMRRGQEANFDPNKMMPGEWAVSLDSKFVRMCFSPGVCIRMATYEAFEADMEQIRGILAECQTVEEAVQRIYEDIKDVAVDVERIEAAAASALKSEENALNSANSAVQSANTATQKATEAAGSANIASTKAEQATEGANTATQKASEAAESADNVRNMSEVSQSYAVGGTGTREGEDTDNAKYYNQQASDNADRAEAAAERASAVADVGVATTEKAGIVKPDGETIRVDSDGTIHADRGTTSYTDLENKPTINDVELDGNKTLNELGIASKEALEETDNKVNIIIENAELRFKETASGEHIHLDDSADSKLVEFALYGKAVQNGTPTPQNPVDIEVAGSGGSVEVKSVGKNLLKNEAATKTMNGITYTVNNDGSIHIKGQKTGTSFINILGDIDFDYQSEKLNLKGKFRRIISPYGKMSFRKTDGTYFGNLTSVQDIGYSGIGAVYFEVISTEPVDFIYYPQIEYGDVMTEYQPYQETTATIPVTNFVGIPVDSGGNYTDQNGQQWICDEVVKYADGSGEYIQRVEKLDLSSVNKWERNTAWINKNAFKGDDVFSNALKVNGYTSKANLICNRFIVDTPDNISRGSFAISQGEEYDIFLAVEGITTDGELISYFKDNETIVYYQLENEITTPLTAEQLAEIKKLKTFYPVTNISNDFDCGMKVKYIADPKSYIDNRLNLIEQAILNSI